MTFYVARGDHVVTTQEIADAINSGTELDITKPFQIKIPTGTSALPSDAMSQWIADSARYRLYIDTYGASPDLIFRKGNGSLTSPSGLTLGSQLGFVSWYGYTSGATFKETAYITINALETFTNTVYGSEMLFATVAVGTGALFPRLSIKGSGIGINETMKFYLDGYDQLGDTYFVSSSADVFELYVGTQRSIACVEASEVDVIFGKASALATNATHGFVYIATSAGTPTGVATSYTGKVALEFDTTNNILYIYNGGWIAIASGGGDMILASAQTVSGAKTFLTGTLKLRDSDNTNTYTIQTSNLTADRVLTVPLLTSGDTFAVLGIAGQTFLAEQAIKIPSGTNTIPSKSILQLVGDGTRNRLYIDSYGTDRPSIFVRASGGSLTTPSAITSGQQIFNIGFAGYHSGGAFSSDDAMWITNTSQNWTSSAMGMYHRIFTTLDGQTSSSETLEIKPLSLYIKTPSVSGNPMDLVIQRSETSPPASFEVGTLGWVANDDANVISSYCAIRGIANDPTSTSRDGAMEFYVAQGLGTGSRPIDSLTGGIVMAMDSNAGTLRWGLFGSLSAKTSAYTVTNPTTDRALNVTADTLAQVAAVLGTLISDLKAYGLLG